MNEIEWETSLQYIFLNIKTLLIEHPPIRNGSNVVVCIGKCLRYSSNLN